MAEDPEKTIRTMGRRVAELRNERGWTQEQFAERLGYSTKYVQRIEAGRLNLSIRSLVRLANVLRTRSIELLVMPASLATKTGRPKKR